MARLEHRVKEDSGTREEAGNLHQRLDAWHLPSFGLYLKNETGSFTFFWFLFFLMLGVPRCHSIS